MPYYSFPGGTNYTEQRILAGLTADVSLAVAGSNVVKTSDASTTPVGVDDYGEFNNTLYVNAGTWIPTTSGTATINFSGVFSNTSGATRTINIYVYNRTTSIQTKIINNLSLPTGTSTQTGSISYSYTSGSEYNLFGETNVGTVQILVDNNSYWQIKK